MRLMLFGVCSLGPIIPATLRLPVEIFLWDGIYASEMMKIARCHLFFLIFLNLIWKLQAPRVVCWFFIWLVGFLVWFCMGFFCQLLCLKTSLLLSFFFPWMRRSKRVSLSGMVTYVSSCTSTLVLPALVSCGLEVSIWLWGGKQVHPS